MAITVINENDYIRDSREVINSNFAELNTLKAPLASPAFTGNPTAPTQEKTDNSTKLATTAYVHAVAADYLSLTGGSITGNLSVSGTITGDLTGDVTGNADTATNATNDGNGNNIANTYLPKTGGTITGDLTVNGQFAYTETATLLAETTTQTGAVQFDITTPYKRYAFVVEVMFSGENWIRGGVYEISRAMLLYKPDHSFNFGSGMENHVSGYFTFSQPNGGLSYATYGISNPTGTITSNKLKIYGIK